MIQHIFFTVALSAFRVLSIPNASCVPQTASAQFVLGGQQQRVAAAASAVLTASRLTFQLCSYQRPAHAVDARVAGSMKRVSSAWKILYDASCRGVDRSER